MKMRDTVDMQQAQLSDIPFDVIEGYLMVRGWVVVKRDWYRTTMMSRPPVIGQRAQAAEMPLRVLLGELWRRALAWVDRWSR